MGIHSDKLKKEMAKQKQQSKKKQNVKREKQKTQLIQLMNCDFILHVVPDFFIKINDFIQKELTRKASYIVTICNNTNAHDLFFKTCKVFKSNKSKYSKARPLRYFRRQQQDDEDNSDNDNEVVVTDDGMEQCDDHLAPLEEANFGDINIKKEYHYSGYLVFEAYPFPNVAHSQQQSTAVAITPQQFKPNAVLNAIDEQHKVNDILQFNELHLGTMSPSTVNKYRRQSLSTASSRRTSLRPINEPSVTTLLDRALDEEMGSNKLPWNDDLDDLIDIVIGWDLELGQSNNSFSCFLQFNEYSQPSFYQKQLKNIKGLRDFCDGGSDGLQVVSRVMNNGVLAANIR